MSTDLGFGAFAVRINHLTDLMSGEGLRKITLAVAAQTKGDGEEAARADQALNVSGTPGMFRGWPVKLETGYTLEADPGQFTIGPKGRSAGPWRVADSGRNPVVVGPNLPTFNKSGKAKRQKHAKRYNGRTDGFGTWSKVEELVDKKVPGRVQTQVDVALIKTFGR